MSRVYDRYRHRPEEGPAEAALPGDRPAETAADAVPHARAAEPGAPLLDVDELRVWFGSGRNVIRAVDGVSLSIADGESVGLVGESGCGKSTLGRTILRLETPQAGRVLFRGRDVHRLKGEEARAFTREAQMIFQDPYGSLNPRLAVGAAIQEVLRVHGAEAGRQGRRAAAEQLFRDVGLDPSFMERYPHEFSGGQRQRIGIARALAAGPRLLIADEPVSALDVSVQVQILNLLKDLQQQHGLTYLFVAHDLAVVRYVCTRVLVMYLGRLVESAPSEALYARPLHPYTQALLSAVPDVDKSLAEREDGTRRRIVLTGDVPSPARRIPGCPFHTRCPYAREHCRKAVPALREVEPAHFAACHYAEEILEGTSGPV